MSSKSFTILYLRSTGSAPAIKDQIVSWQNGFMITTPSSGWIWLKDSNKVTIRKGTIANEIMKKIIPGGSITCAGYDIKILIDAAVKSNSNVSVKIDRGCTDSNRLKNVIDDTLSKQERKQQPQQQQQQQNINDRDSSSLDSSRPAATSYSTTSSLSSTRDSRGSSGCPTVSNSHHNSRNCNRSNDNDSSYDSNSSSSNQISNHSINSDSHRSVNSGSSMGSNNYTSYPTLDSVVVAVMREHQKEAAIFLLAKLMGGDTINSKKVGLNISTSNDTREIENTNIYDSGDNEISVTGAILADDMGTGKTLIGLSVIWSLCRHGRCKGIIVCPSSLIGNWEREMKKWLPTTLGRTALFVTSGKGNGPRGSQRIVGKFLSSHTSEHPVLVISYEMFRTYAVAFNTLSTLEVLLCDEGHRLKNAYGTSTTLALGNCCAMRRLVLTGTPIQNNLEELFAVVQFTSPGYLGSLQEFKKAYSDPIDKGRASHASKKQAEEGAKATTALRLRMAHILLRRTRDIVLQAILPPRKDYLLHCDMCAPQRDQYLQESDLLLQTIGSGSGATAHREENSMVAKNNVVFGEYNSDGDDDDNNISDENDSRKWKGKQNVDRLNNDKNGRASTSDSSKGIKGVGIGSGVLPNIMQLRQICDFATWDGEDSARDVHDKETRDDGGDSCGITDVGKDNPQLSTDKYRSYDDSNDASSFKEGEEEKEKKYLKKRQSTEQYVSKLLQHSGKLKVLDELLNSIRQLSPPEKVVVVSNFTTSLDALEAIARYHKWMFLRLDGSVMADKRLSLVQHFNSERSPFFLMLLSAKAGGVGLNLTGGSRLVMLEPDWNPATDQQAMGRVWRDGQTRPVHIYRMITKGTIEESILKRQALKGALSAVIQENSIGPLHTVDKDVGVDRNKDISMIKNNSKKRKLVQLVEGLEDVSGATLFPEEEAEKETHLTVMKKSVQNSKVFKKEEREEKEDQSSIKFAPDGGGLIEALTSASKTIRSQVVERNELQSVGSVLSSFTPAPPSVSEDLILPRGRAFLLRLGG